MPLSLFAEGSRFTIGYIELGRDHPKTAQAGHQFIEELNLRTQVDPFPKKSWRKVDKSLEKAPPFLWLLVGDQAQFDQAFIQKLQRFISSGGTVFAEPSGGTSSLDKLIQLSEKVFGHEALQKVKKDDLITRTFYFTSPNYHHHLSYRLDGERLVWMETNVPLLLRMISAGFGPIPKEEATRIATNIIIYTLTGSYKDDLTHVRYLLRRKRSR